MTKANRRNQQARAQQGEGGGAAPAAPASEPGTATATSKAASATAQQQATQQQDQAQQQQQQQQELPPNIGIVTLSKLKGASIRSFNPAKLGDTTTTTSSVFTDLLNGAPVSSTVGTFSQDCRASVSPCGKMIAFADEKQVFVYGFADNCTKLHQLLVVEAPRCIQLSWSPKSTYLQAFAQHDARRNADSNLLVLRVPSSASAVSASNSDLVALRVGQSQFPAIFWTPDESFAVRRSQQTVVVCKGDLSDSASSSKLQQQFPPIGGTQKEINLAVPDGAVAQGAPFLAIFTPQVKQTNAAVTLYRLPDLTTPVMVRPVGRGDRCTMQFSPNGMFITCLVRCDDDRTGTNSYYGASFLHVISIAARTAVTMPLSEGESVHDAKWNPRTGSGESEFVVVHGVMPRNKATLFSVTNKTDGSLVELYRFGEAPRNTCHWAPSGAAFALGGTGSLPGDYTLHSRELVGKPADGKIGSFSEKTSHQFWLPDSRHFACVNLFGTLKMSNKLIIFKYTGEKVLEEKFTATGDDATTNGSNSSSSGSDALFDVAFATPLDSPALKAACWSRRLNSPVKDPSRLQAKLEAFRPRHQSAAAAAMLALPANSVGSAGGASSSALPIGNRAPGAAPVGAQVAAPAKKKGGRR